MNKKIVAIVLCMLMFATIPIVAGMQTTQTSSPPDDTGLLSKTYVRGFIISHHRIGLGYTFFAICCHYTTHNFLRPPESGFFILKQVTFLRKFTGHIGMFYIHGMFRGTPIM
jgi:hypothetical protein